MRHILKQTSFLILAQVLTRFIGFFYTIFLARNLGVSDFGLLTVSLAYFSIISSVSDFGFNRFLVRELAKDKLKTSELVCNVVMLRITLSALLFAIFALFLYFFDQDKMRVSLILLAVLAILPQSIALTFDSIFVATHRLHFSAIALICSSLFTAFAGTFLVSRGLGVYGAVNALMLGQLIYAAAILVLLYKYLRLLLSSIRLSIIKKALAESLPYGLLGVLGLLYFRIDTLILAYLKGSFETGLYGTAYRFLEAVIFVPSAFATALFPTLAKLHDVNLYEMKRIYWKSFKLMVVMGIVILAIYIFVLPILIEILLPDYLPAIKAIKILSLSLPFIFISAPGVQLMLSTEKYLKQVLILSVVMLTFNVALNLIFIPKFGFLAAAWITVLSDILSFTIFFLFIKFQILDRRN